MNNNEFIQLVDKAINHLEAQGHPAADAGGNCLYEYEDNNLSITARCIVGWMIEDEATRNKADESGDVISGLVKRNTWGRHLTTSQVSFLEVLQEIHDSLGYHEAVEEYFQNGIRDMRHALAKYSEGAYQLPTGEFLK